MTNKIILIHTGNYFPEYINDCIQQINTYGFETHLVLSEKLHESVKDTKVILSKAEDYENNQYQNYSIKKDNNFRDGFWTRTSSRFFLLSEYSKQNNMKNVFHIENDILLFDDLKGAAEILEQDIFDMSIVIDSETRCVPSIVWFRNHQILEKLANFIFLNINNDDMVNLKLFHSLNSESVTNFPIFPTERYNSQSVKYDNKFDKFSCIFDGAAIGQFLGGVDSRNISGNTVGFVNETAVFPVDKYKYIWYNTEPYIEHDEQKVKILNLHMHCKDLKTILKENK